MDRISGWEAACLSVGRDVESGTDRLYVEFSSCHSEGTVGSGCAVRTKNILVVAWWVT